MSTTLYVTPPALALPNARPLCLVAQCALRFAACDFDECYEWNDAPRMRIGEESELSPERRRTPLQTRAAGADEAGTTTVSGIKPILLALQKNGANMDAGLKDADRALTTAVVAMVESVLFPAFDALVYAYDRNFNMYAPALAQGRGLVSRVWNTTSTLRKRKLEDLKRVYGGTVPSAEAVTKKCEEALQSLETLLHSSHDYYLNASTPSTIDCYVYAGVSCLLHTQWHEASQAAAFQREMQTNFPKVSAFAERIRLKYFECYATVYRLRGVGPIDISEVQAARDEDLYSPGRTKAVVMSLAFAGIYFACVNPQVILALMGVDVDYYGEEDGADGEHGGGIANGTAE